MTCDTTRSTTTLSGEARAHVRAPRVAWALTTLVGALALFGCRGSGETEASAGAAEPPAAEAAARALVSVDPSLLSAGRVRTAGAVARGAGPRFGLPGEVLSSLDGEAEVGGLASGRVATIEVDVGDVVKAGALLARIDAPEVGALRADYLRAQALSEAAARRLERQRALEKDGATSQSAIDVARAEASALAAEVAAVRARLAALGAAPEPRGSARLEVRSPIAGVVVERRATLGRAIAPEETLFRVVDGDKLVIEARFPETLGAPPAVGTEFELSPRRGAEDGSARCKARVSSGVGAVDPTTRSVVVRLSPLGPCSLLRPGAYVDVVSVAEAPGGSESTGTAAPAGVIVPVEALVDVRGVPTVFVAAAEPGKFEARPVLPGPTVGQLVTIESGVAPGEQVVTTGVLLLKGQVLRDVLGGE